MIRALRKLFRGPDSSDRIETGRRVIATTVRGYARVEGPARFAIVAMAERDDPDAVRFIEAFDAADFAAMRAFSWLGLVGDGFIVYAIEEPDESRPTRLILVYDPNDLFRNTQFFNERVLDAASAAELHAIENLPWQPL